MNDDDCPNCGAGSIARDPHTHACAVCEARRVSDHFRRLNGSLTPEARAIRESQREALQAAAERARDIIDAQALNLHLASRTGIRANLLFNSLPFGEDDP
jgi:hypothetical protein